MAKPVDGDVVDNATDPPASRQPDHVLCEPERVDAGAQYEWDDDALVVDGDDRRQALYRRLQSWYRQKRLDAPHGWTKPRAATAKRPAAAARPVGSRLDATWAADHPTGNFLQGCDQASTILAYVDDRAPRVIATGGALDPVRLRRNLLSSMPLCFNLMVPLRGHPAIALEVLRLGFGIDADELATIHGIEGIECEWSPLGGTGLGGGTAFDAVIAYRTKGRTCLLGIEAKYTEKFSATRYGEPDNPAQTERREVYTRWTRAGWFLEGAEDRLHSSVTNQLWRNVMLGASCEELPGVDRVDVAVVALHDDPHADAAIAGVRADLHPDHRDRLRFVPIERLVRILERQDDLAGWAGTFTERYLDTTPALRATLEDRDRLQQFLDATFPVGCELAHDLGDAEPYVFRCPHPVVTLVDHHLEVFVWREDSWSRHALVTAPNVPKVLAPGTALTLEAGRFELRDVLDPGIREAMRRLRLTPEEVEYRRGG